jgi:hypothetical protein
MVELSKIEFPGRLIFDQIPDDLLAALPGGITKQAGNADLIGQGFSKSVDLNSFSTGLSVYHVYWLGC